MTCPPCADLINRWLDYYATPQPNGVLLAQIGNPKLDHVVESRRRRATDKARLVREQVAAIKENCAHNHSEMAGNEAA